MQVDIKTFGEIGKSKLGKAEQTASGLLWD